MNSSTLSKFDQNIHFPEQLQKLSIKKLLSYFTDDCSYNYFKLYEIIKNN